MMGVNQNADKRDAYHRPSGVLLGFFSPKREPNVACVEVKFETISPCDC